MEINTEINKVFGEEMAKLFANQISEEELIKMSKEAWKEITNHPIKWRDPQPSKLEELIRKELVDKLLQKVYEIMQETTSEEWIKKEAEKIANEAKERSHKLMVDSISENITKSIFHNYDVAYVLRSELGNIANAIVNRR